MPNTTFDSGVGDAFDRANELALQEFERAGRKLEEEVGEANAHFLQAMDWRFWLNPFNFMGAKVSGPLDVWVHEVLSALQNLGQRIALIPGRTIAILGGILFTGPKPLGTTVIKLDKALELVPFLIVQAALDMNVEAHGAPLLIIKKKIVHWADTWRFWRYLDFTALFRIWKARAIKVVKLVSLAIIQFIFALFLCVLFRMMHNYVNDPANWPVLRSFGLQQKNPLVHDQTLGRKRLRSKP